MSSQSSWAAEIATRLEIQRSEFERRIAGVADEIAQTIADSGTSYTAFLSVPETAILTTFKLFPIAGRVGENAGEVAEGHLRFVVDCLSFGCSRRPSLLSLEGDSADIAQRIAQELTGIAGADEAEGAIAQRLVRAAARFGIADQTFTSKGVLALPHTEHTFTWDGREYTVAEFCSGRKVEILTEDIPTFDSSDREYDSLRELLLFDWEGGRAGIYIACGYRLAKVHLYIDPVREGEG